MRYRFKNRVIDGVLYFEARKMAELLADVVKRLGLVGDLENLKKLENYIDRCEKVIEKKRKKR